VIRFCKSLHSLKQRQIESRNLIMTDPMILASVDDSDDLWRDCCQCKGLIPDFKGFKCVTKNCRHELCSMCPKEEPPSEINSPSWKKENGNVPVKIKGSTLNAGEVSTVFDTENHKTQTNDYAKTQRYDYTAPQAYAYANTEGQNLINQKPSADTNPPPYAHTNNASSTYETPTISSYQTSASFAGEDPTLYANANPNTQGKSSFCRCVVM
jgi:hypothetical protein